MQKNECFMNILVFIIASLIIITKLLDVMSTLYRIHHSSQETNPIAGRLMEKYGVKRVSWAVFFLVVLIVILSSFIVWISPFKTLALNIFILLGLFVSIVQSAVAYANYKGRNNLVTRIVRRVHRLLEMTF